MPGFGFSFEFGNVLVAGGGPVPAAPTLVSAAVIDIGDGLVGTVATATPGTWDGADSVSGQWQYNNISWEAIGGETELTLSLTELSAGHPLRYLEAATNAGGSAQEPSSPETPQALSVPAWSVFSIGADSLTVGSHLYLVNSFVFSANPPVLLADISYQWKRNGEAISGETNPLGYTLTESDASQSITLSAEATNSVGPGGVLSPPASPDALSPPTNAVAPVIVEGSGAADLTSLGEWDGNPAPNSYTRQWQYFVTGAWVDNPGATGNSIGFTSGMGDTVRCVVTAFAGVYQGSKESNTLS